MSGTVYEDMHLKSHGINRKSRVLSLSRISSATWSSIPKKHYNVFINQLINQSIYYRCVCFGRGVLNYVYMQCVYLYVDGY